MSEAGEVCFPRESLEYVEERFTRLWELIGDVAKSFTSRGLETRALTRFVPRFLVNSAISEDEAHDFMLSLASVPLTEFIVTRDLRGATLSNRSRSIDLGPFTVCNYEHGRLPFRRNARYIRHFVEVSDAPVLVVSVSSFAREPARAVELADQRFDEFERILQYMAGGGYDARVLNYVAPHNLRAVVSAKGRVSSVAGFVQNSMKSLPIDAPLLVSESTGNQQIWSMYAKVGASEVQIRLLVAVSWIGDAIQERVPQAAFLKAAVAAEVLLTRQEGVISPSILHSMAESVALILGTTVDERLHLTARMKSLYAKRSAVTHAGQAEITARQLNELLILVRRLVVAFLTVPALKSCTTLESVAKLLSATKYACPAV